MGTFRQMAYWLAIVEEGSFTRAAARMHVSQPSLSQQVRALEEELGGELLERLPRSVRLTSAGKAFLPHARAAVHSADRAVRSAREQYRELRHALLADKRAAIIRLRDARLIDDIVLRRIQSRLDAEELRLVTTHESEPE